MPENWLTAEQVSEHLQVPIKVVNQLVRDGKLSCVQLSERRRRFTVEQLDEFMARHTKAQRIPVDKKTVRPLPSSKKGGVKSSRVSKAELRKEISSWR